ncbi:MAG: outer membrane beta-barrel protein [Pseudomonadota bacterium]
MARSFASALVGAVLISPFSSAIALAADADDFSDFPEVPEVERFDAAFRAAGGYIGVRGGAVFAEETDVLLNTTTRIDNAYERALSGAAFIGFEIPDLYHGIGFRLELEFGQSRLDVETHTVGGTLIAEADSFGETISTFGFANAYVDLAIPGTSGALRPFVGGGIGLARTVFDNHGVTGSLGVLHDANTSWAWQVMGGAGLDVTSQITLEAMVRHQAMMDIDLVSTTGQVSTTDLTATQVLLGARLRF